MKPFETVNKNMLFNQLQTYVNFSNLAWVIEMTVVFHLSKYLFNNSAFKSDIMMSIDLGKLVLLVLLDLFTAFRTVDHNLPFSRVHFL